MLLERQVFQKTSVSRYLGGRFDELSAKTRKKIELAINKMEYRPKHDGKRAQKQQELFDWNHRGGHQQSIYDGHPSGGAEDICSQNGYNLMICNSDNNPEKERGYFDMLLSHRIDGLIIHTTGGNHDMLKTDARAKDPDHPFGSEGARS
ncbi:hypothetical protein RCO48_20520 [Peribacillus frigoritolerans]|nr:hypothetical protein [Peribacillus frigoritolerans]